MDYGSFIYFPRYKQGKLKLERLQNQAIRLALGLRKSTPINVLLSESKIVTLEERAKYLYKTFLTKSLSNTRSQKFKKVLIECCTFRSNSK